MYVLFHHSDPQFHLKSHHLEITESHLSHHQLLKPCFCCDVPPELSPRFEIKWSTGFLILKNSVTIYTAWAKLSNITARKIQRYFVPRGKHQTIQRCVIKFLQIPAWSNFTTIKYSVHSTSWSYTLDNTFNIMSLRRKWQSKTAG